MKYLAIKLYLFLFLTVTFGIAPGISIAQTLDNQENSIIDASKKLIFSNPNEAIRIAIQLSKNENNSNFEIAKINYILSKAYLIKGDYNNSLKSLYAFKNHESYLSDFEKQDLLISKIKILRELSLDKESKKLLVIADKNSALITNLIEKAQAKKAIQIEKANFLFKEHRFEEGIQLLLSQTKNKLGTTTENSDLDLSAKIILGDFYLKQRDFASSENYYKAVYSIITNQKTQNLYQKVLSLSGLADICFFRKEHNKGLLILKEALLYSQKLQNSYLQEMIFKQLNANYLAINDTSNYKISNANFIQIQSKIEISDQESVNAAYNLISKQYVNNFSQNISKYDTILYNILLFILLIILVFIFIYVKYAQRLTNLNELVKYLQITKNNFTKIQIEKKQESKKTLILKETEEQILTKLKKFETSKRFLNKDFSLAILAGQLDTNTKYLSEVINSHYQMNFNTYVNKLRINYIVEKLKTDPNFIKYRISYLAENCGFTSHSAFATVFKNITGLTPVKFIEFLNNENKISEV
jgi:AraC-like DNA-binding protein